ncbi:MAG: beta-N-acetylhexosaminidase [Gammaproteobacteria bacterium]|nr:beta-N-acetylhexosaminidase [Gammaproteobacteria bacterium]
MPLLFSWICSLRMCGQKKRFFLSHPLLAGIVLFSRNYENPEQLAHLLEQVRLINPHVLFAVDQEGGRVQRFKDPFTSLPAMGKFGQRYLLDEEGSQQLVHDCAWLVGSELAAFGIHINFAPVLDLNLGLNDVIGDRAFHHLSEVVCVLGRAYLAGIKPTGVLSVAKHFPGHGGVDLDSHVDQPVNERSLEEIWGADMRPFRKLVRDIPAIMISHVIYSAVSPMPAGFCRFWLGEMLRGRLNSDAFVFSDCLSMKAAQVAGSAVSRICLAYEAGCDYVLLCNHPENYLDVLSAVDSQLMAYPSLPSSKTYPATESHPVSAEDTLKRWKGLQASDKYCMIQQALKTMVS